MDDYLSARAQAARRRPGGLRGVLIALGAAFLLGAVAAWYLFGNAGALGELFSISREEAAAGRTEADAPGPQALPVRSAAEQLALADGLDRRVAEMEQRLAQLDVQARAAESNAARAEGLLIALSARRAVERGAPLGYLAEQLRLRFGQSRGEAVRTVVAATRDPVTLDRLLARLDGLVPQLTQPPASEGTWSWLSRQAGSLFVVRREDTPSPAPQRRVERARLFLESGRIEAAIAEVRMMPNAAVAADWVADAQRYADAQRALETLEMAALIEPRATGASNALPPAPVIPAR